jgi:DNA ligase-1
MIHVLDALRMIESESSRNRKEEILSSFNDHEELKKLLEYTMNPYKVFGIGSKTFKKFKASKIDTQFENIFELLDYLLVHNTGTDQDKIEVNKFLAAHPEEDQEWYKRIILKDLKMGMTAKSVNKVFKNLIPEFSVALAEPFERIFEYVSIEPKLDGVRCTAVKRDGVTNLFTRNGKSIEGFPDIIQQINDLPIDDIVFDGEIMGKDYKDTMEKLFKKTGVKEANYHIFDILPVDEFYNGESKKPYHLRRADLVDIAYKFGGDSSCLKLVKVYAYIEDPSVEEITKWVSIAESEGYEGTMVKNCKATYKCKRTYDIQKCKTFFSDEFVIVGFEEGDGKYQGTLGKVIVDVDGLQVGVGSGFTDEERRDIWNNQDKYLGMQIEVQYQEKIAKTGSLRFPTVKSIRYDK